MSSRRRILRCGLAALTAAFCGGRAAYGEQALSDQQLRAAYLLNFLRYVDWPERTFATAEAPLILGVLGTEAAAALGGLAGKLVKGRVVAVRAVVSVDDARACHGVYFPDPDSRRYVGLIRSLHGLPILTVGDADGFIDIGGMIGLVYADNRLQFEINVGALGQAQLKASSQLLRLARNVVEGRRS